METGFSIFKSCNYSFVGKSASLILALFLFFEPIGTALADQIIKTERENRERSVPAAQDIESNLGTSDTSEAITTSDVTASPVEEEGGMAAAMSGGAGSGFDTGALFISDVGLRTVEIQPDTQSGAMQYTYPIVVPPGRGAMTPKVELTYDSNNRDNSRSIFGYGWSISIPSISLVNKTGTQNFFTASSTYESSWDGELSKINTTTYVPKVENGAYRKYTFSNNVWTVYEKDGTKYSFGSTTQARLDNSASSTQIYAWMLEEVRDMNGNYIKYLYAKDHNQLYPSSIRYTGYGANEGAFRVDFTTESRPDPYSTYQYGFAATTSLRVSQIKTWVNDGESRWAKTYSLAYGSGNNGVRSLLTSITEEGQPEDGSPTIALPPTKFSYEDYDGNSWAEDTSRTVPYNITRGKQSYDDGVRFADINGDGLVDLLRAWDTTLWPAYAPAAQESVLLNTGTGWATSTTWHIPLPQNGRMAFAGRDSVNGQENLDTGARLADVNGDGYTDIIWAGAASGSAPPNWSYSYDFGDVYINNKQDGWATTSTWQLPTGFHFSEDNRDDGTTIADINGDGLPDLLKYNYYYNPGWPAQIDKAVYINTGAGWKDASSTWDLPVPIIDNNVSATVIDDINGDGLADIIQRIDSDYSAGVNRAYLNTGSGWEWAPQYLPPIAFGYRYLNYQDQTLGTRLADINGDGLPDIFNGGEVYLNTGSGWSVAASAEAPSDMYLQFVYSSNGLHHVDAGVRLMDIDGDNMVDLVKSGPINSYPSFPQLVKVTLHEGTVPDLLSAVVVPQGATTTAVYTQSALYDETSGNSSNPTLPFNLNTVSELTYDSGFSPSYSNTYHYGGGSYYYGSITDRFFAGFATTTTTNAHDYVLKTYAHQGNGTSTANEFQDRRSKVGKIYLVEQYDDAGNLFQRTVTRWGHTTSSGSEFVYKMHDLTRDYDGDSDTKDAVREYTYDAKGNVTSRIEWGLVTGNTNGGFSDSSADKRTISYTYATNTSKYILGLPSSETLTDQSGAKIKESLFYYDNLSLGSVSKGNLTKRENWVSGTTTYSSAQSAYNGFGLKTSDTDPRGYVTSYTYDPLNLYPATTTNPLSQKTRYEYDYTSGKVQTTIDPNGYLHVVNYDALDRPIEVLEPNATDGSPVTVETNVYTDAARAVSVHNIKYLEASSTVDAYTYFDGVGRAVQTRVEDENANRFIVRNSVYGPDGVLAKESLPYFSNGAARTSPSSTANLYASYTYDPLGRVTETDTAVGATTRSYDQWTETVTDPVGNDKAYTYDAHKRLASVAEHEGNDTYTTSYLWREDDALERVTDAMGNLRTFTYDNLGRRLTARNLHAPSDSTYGAWSYAYDAAGNIATSTNPKNQKVSYAYDGLNRPLTENFTSQGGTEITYIYDTCTNGKGKLCQVSYNNGSTTYAYAPSGTVNTENRVIEGASYVTATSYDRLGNLARVTYPDNSVVEYIRNGAGQLERIRQRESDGSFRLIVEDFDYGPNGMVTYQNFGNGADTTRTYDANELYRLRSIVTTAPSFVGGLVEEEGGAVGDLLPLADAVFSIDETGVIDVGLDVLEASDTSVLPEVPADLQEITNVDTISTSTATSTEPSEPPVMPDVPSDELLPIDVPEPGVTTSTESTLATSTESGMATSTPVEKVVARGVLLQDKLEILMSRNPAVADAKVEVLHIRPEVRLQRWSGDVDLGVAYRPVGDAPARLLESGIVEWGEGATKVHAYELPANEQMEGGGFEIEVVLDEKPLSNAFTFNLTGTNDLEFYYQAPLNQEVKDSDEVSCTEMQCRNENGEVVRERPENVIGSYAVYHKTRSGQEEGALNYATGKAYHIYRPKAIDATGKDVWAELDYNNGALTVTVPQAFLDEATYPVRVDPTFGLSSVGGSIGSITPQIVGSPAAPLQSGQVTSISLYGKSAGGPGALGAALYSDNGGPDIKLAEDLGNVDMDATLAWRTMPIATTVVASGTPYWLMFSPTETFQIYYDTATHTRAYYGNQFDEWPSPLNEGPLQSERMSMYATYTTGISSASGLLTEGTVNPTGVVDGRPEFSAIFLDPDSGDLAAHYQIQVSTSTSFTNPLWNSGKVALASSTPSGHRIADITYGGPTLASSTVYRWRIRFWDNGGTVGGFSTTTATFSLNPIPQGLLPIEMLQNLRYEYDAVGNIVKIVDRSETGTAATTTYAYDDLYRLLQASTTVASTSPYAHSYTYNAIGNLLTRSDIGTYAYEGTIGTSYANPHAATSIGGVTYAYDRNGNLASTSAGQVYTWNYRDELVGSTDGANTATYLYDHTGSRILKDAGGTTAHYPSRMYEMENGTSTKNIFAGDVLVATIEGTGATSSALYYDYTDHLGSTNVVTDSDGYTAQVLSYYPFGNARIEDQYGAIDQSRKYIGQEYDEESELSYLNARYYEGSRGQFLSQDPVYWEMGQGTPDSITALQNPQLQNSYSYAGNNPITHKDPTGRFVQYLAMLFMPSVAYSPDVGEEDYTNTGLETGIAVAGFASPSGRLGKAVDAASQIAKNRAAGAMGEKVAGIVKNTQTIPSVTKPGTNRIPDVLNHNTKVIGDVKNVNYQSFTSQLKDFANYAQNNSYKFTLTVDQRTQLSKTLQQLGKQLEVIRKNLKKE